MRYDKEHKQETRSRIVKVAAERFRREGIEAVGVASLMGSAGLTHGGFYAHFPSKEALVIEACAEGLSETIAGFAELVMAAPEGRRLRRLVKAYLSEQHRDEPEKGCMLATLGPELARYPAAARHAFSQRVDALQKLLGKTLSADGADPALAGAIVSILVGALIMARTTDDPEQSRSCLENGQRAALTLAGLAE